MRSAGHRHHTPGTPAENTGSLTLEKSVDIEQPMMVGLVPDCEGQIWFATQGSLSPGETPAVMGFYDPWAETIKTYNLPAGEMVADSIASSPAGGSLSQRKRHSIFSMQMQVARSSPFGGKCMKAAAIASQGSSAREPAPHPCSVQGMTLGTAGSSLVTDWTGSSVSSSAPPMLSLADNVIYTIIVDFSTTGLGRTLQTTETYSFAAVGADTGEIMGTPLEVGSNTFSGTSPNYANTGSYTWNTLQMTGAINPAGVFYQGTAGGLFMVRQRQTT
jgi:hypothetical protein